MKVICKDGMGRKENPHPEFIGMMSDSYPRVQNSGWKDFDKEHQPLPVLDANGKMADDGTWDCMISRQCWSDGQWNFCESEYCMNDGRPVYQITTPIPEKENNKAETVREAAMIEMGVSYEPHMSNQDQAFIEGAEFGANWQKEQQNKTNQ